MCFKLGMCFGVAGGDDYYRATQDPSDHKGYTTAPADETCRKANNDVARKAVTAAAYPQEKADEPSPKPPAAARNSKVADDTGVKQPAAPPAVISRQVRSFSVLFGPPIC